MRRYNFLRQAETGESGGGGGASLPEGLNLTFSRLGINPTEISDEKTFFEALGKSEIAKSYFPKPEPIIGNLSKMYGFEKEPDTLESLAELINSKNRSEAESEIFGIFAEKFGIDTEKLPDDITWEDLAETLSAKKTDGEPVDFKKLREFELKNSELLEKLAQFESPDFSAKIKTDALNEFKIDSAVTEAVLKNERLSKPGRTNAELVKAGFFEYLKSKGIEPKVSDGAIKLFEGERPAFKAKSSEPAAISDFVEAYLEERGWLNENNTSGSGNLAQIPVAQKNPFGVRPEFAHLTARFAGKN